MDFTSTRNIPRDVRPAAAAWTISAVARNSSTVIAGIPVVGWAYRPLAGRSSDYPFAVIADDLGGVRFADEIDGAVLLLGPGQTATAGQTSALVARAAA